MDRVKQAVVVSVLLASAGLPAKADKPDYCGIWAQRDADVSNDGKPWLRGALVTVDWRDIEREEGRFHWPPLDKQITQVAGRGMYVMFAVMTGSECPDWIYAKGVPEVETKFDKTRDGKPARFPYYLDDTYRTLFRAMVRAVAQHVQSAFPPEIRKRIIAVQCPVGASGDPHPYKEGGPDEPGKRGGGLGSGKFAISEKQWNEFQQEMFRFYHDQYKDSTPRIHCLFNTASDQGVHEWVIRELPGSWCKTNRIGDRYQNNKETVRSSNSWVLPSIRSFLPSGLAVRSRSEMDLTNRDWFKEDPVGNMYWTQLWGLHCCQDIHNQRARDLADTRFHFAFDFYTRYAGYKDLRDSHGVWCALRDGLDAADTERFPEAAYGAVQRGRNPARYEAISRAFARFGARQSDPSALEETSWHGLNDVGYLIHPGNYQFGLTQSDPNGTSQGLWRQGPAEQGYGRFARRFDHASGKDQMCFAIQRTFLFGQPLAGRHPVTIRVVYLDAGSGRWALEYDGIKGRTRAAEVQKRDSGRWKEFTVEIGDAHFGGRLPANADVALVNTDVEDDAFHMVEITRPVGDRKGVWGTGDPAERERAERIPDAYRDQPVRRADSDSSAQSGGSSGK